MSDEVTATWFAFSLGEEHYAIPIGLVQEIIGYQRPTRIPRVDPAIQGVINLRGRVIPVLDLRRLLAFGSAAVTAQTCIVIIIPELDENSEVLGLIVDAVHEVAHLAATDIEPPPDFGDRVDHELLHGVARQENRLLNLLAIDRAIAGLQDGASGEL